MGTAVYWWNRIGQLISRFMSFYAVRRGFNPGVYGTWPECQKQVVKFPAARYKKFATRALAQAFVNGEDHPDTSDGPMTAGYDIMQACSSSSNSWKSSSLHNATQITKLLNDAHKLMSRMKSDIAKSGAEVRTLTSLVNKAETDINNSISSVAEMTKTLHRYSDDGSLKRELAHSQGSAMGKKPRVGFHEINGNVVVYTDGACSNNGTANPRAGIGVWFGPDHPRNICARLPGRQTNNRAEIHAACEAIDVARSESVHTLEIRTDSKFMIQSMTEWLPGWKKRNWTLSTGGPVKNAEDFIRLDSLCCGINIKWVHVKGHSGDVGNDAADQLAVAGARKPLPHQE